MVELLRVSIGARALVFGLIDPHELFPHEETIPSHLGELVHDLQRRGVQLDPILVDTRTRVVLDGMHRLVALDRLGARRVVTCFVDYEDPALRLERWFRRLAEPSAPLRQQLERELQLRPAASAEAALLEAETNRSCLALLGAEKSFVSDVPMRVVTDIYALLRNVDRLAGEYGAAVHYEAEVMIHDPAKGGTDLVVATPRLSKDDIIQCGLRRWLLPPKSTRHLFPIRPVGVRVPLQLLKKTQNGAATILEHSVRHFRQLPSGTFYEGRLYAEPLVSFG